MKKPNLGSLHRRFTSLFVALVFIVLSVTGVLAFVRPFSIEVVGLHALTGFLFVILAVFHIVNNIRPLKGYLHSKSLWFTLAVTATLTVVFFRQPQPVKAILGLSANLGPALDRFEMSEDEMVYQYSPADGYKMALTIKAGKSYDANNPPLIAIWLENQGTYHIKTLLAPDPAKTSQLPYWNFKLKGWEKAKQELKNEQEQKNELQLDAIARPTPNGSFDPADYILPADPENTNPYKLLIEINQPADPHGSVADQPSLVYSVEIDNLDPHIFQLLDIVGYPKRDKQISEDGKEAWSLYYPDDGLGTALKLIDSGLLIIERGE
jgi:hypothetical protein